MDTAPPDIARTDRLLLRHATADDAAFLLRLLNEPSWLQNIGDRGVRTLEDARRFIETRMRPSYREQGFGMYVVQAQADGAVVGLSGLVRRAGLDGPDLGFALLPEHWGKGYALEAARAVLAHARALGIARLLAIVLPGNAPSRRLLETLGFVAEGRVRLDPDDAELLLYATAP